MVPYVPHSPKNESASRRRDEGREGTQGDRMVEKNSLDSSSTNSRVEAISKKQDEMNEKLNEVLLTVNNMMEYMKNLHGHHKLDCSKFMMQGNVRTSLNDDIGNKVYIQS